MHLGKSLQYIPANNIYEGMRVVSTESGIININLEIETIYNKGTVALKNKYQIVIKQDDGWFHLYYLNNAPSMCNLYFCEE